MNMREQRTIVDGVDFGSVFQFHTIFGAIANSMRPARLIIGLGMVLVIVATGRLWDSMAGAQGVIFNQAISVETIQQQRKFSIAQSATALGHVAPDESSGWSVQDAQVHLIESWKDFLFEGEVSQAERSEIERIYLELEEVRPRGPFESSSIYVSNAWTNIVDAGLNLDPVEMWRGIVSIVWELPQHLWQGGFHWFISVYGFILIYVLCIGGGALSRMQACSHSRAHRLSMREAIDFSLFRAKPLLIAIIGPAMFVASITIMIMIMGLVFMNIPLLNIVGGVLYGISLLLGFLVAVIAVGYATCFGMLIPAVVVEDCSGGEAIQRSYAYLFSRTLHFAGYLSVLIVSLILGFIFVRFIANLTLDLTANLVGTLTFNNSLQGAGSVRDSAIPVVGNAWYESSAAGLIHIWETGVHYLKVGWFFSGFFSASTMLYLLMRKTCDGQDTRDIWWQGLIQGTNVPENYDSDDFSSKID